MRYDAPFLVLRLSHPVGRPHLPKQISVDHQAYDLTAAVRVAADRQQQALGARDWRRGSYFWIEHRGEGAHVRV